METILDMKFLVDAMLGKLARFLRIFGYDTIYADDLNEHFKTESIPDDLLKQYAEENDLIIITKDLPFHKRITKKSIYLKGEGVYNYLKQLKVEFGLQYNFDAVTARCSVCNSGLEKVKKKEQIKDKIEPESYKHHNKFYQCLSCEKIFWKGSHLKDILKKIEKID